MHNYHYKPWDLRALVSSLYAAVTWDDVAHYDFRFRNQKELRESVQRFYASEVAREHVVWGVCSYIIPLARELGYHKPEEIPSVATELANEFVATWGNDDRENIGTWVGRWNSLGRHYISSYKKQDSAELVSYIDTEHSPVNSEVYGSDHIAKVRKIVDNLPNIQKYVLVRRYGLIGDEMTLAEIGGELSRSRERIRQISNAALKRLKAGSLHLDRH